MKLAEGMVVIKSMAGNDDPVFRWGRLALGDAGWADWVTSGCLAGLGEGGGGGSYGLGVGQPVGGGDYSRDVRREVVDASLEAPKLVASVLELLAAVLLWLRLFGADRPGWSLIRVGQEGGEALDDLVQLRPISNLELALALCADLHCFLEVA